MDEYPGQQLRHWTNYFTTAANASEQSFSFVNAADDYRMRHLKGIYVGVFTAGVTLKVYVESQPVMSVDLTRFNNGNVPFHIQVDVPPQIQPQISLQNLAGTALTNVPVVLDYTVDNGTGK